MNEFKYAYQSAMQDVREFHIDISDCINEKKHNRRVMRQVRRVTAAAFSAMCVIFICGFGTVKAAEYIQNVITVKDWGFESADAVTISRNEGEDSMAFVLDEQVKEQLTTEEIPIKNYTSWVEFEQNEDIIFASPSISIGENIESTDITVCDDWVMVRYDVDGKVLWIERTDYADTNGHASSKAFPSGICNERTYTTPQGYTYTLIDSIKESEEEPLQIHAAVTVGSYEAYLDFRGFTNTQAEEILDSVDLSLYE